MPKRIKKAPETPPVEAVPAKKRKKSAKSETKQVKTGAKQPISDVNGKKSAKKTRSRKKAAVKTPKHAPDAKELELIRKRNKILDLREGGASIRQISLISSSRARPAAHRREFTSYWSRPWRT
jgi:hypothetical protein